MRLILGELWCWWIERMQDEQDLILGSALWIHIRLTIVPVSRNLGDRETGARIWRLAESCTRFTRMFWFLVRKDTRFDPMFVTEIDDEVVVKCKNVIDKWRASKAIMVGKQKSRPQWTSNLTRFSSLLLSYTNFSPSKFFLVLPSPGASACDSDVMAVMRAEKPAFESAWNTNLDKNNRRQCTSQQPKV